MPQVPAFSTRQSAFGPEWGFTGLGEFQGFSKQIVQRVLVPFRVHSSLFIADLNVDGIRAWVVVSERETSRLNPLMAQCRDKSLYGGLVL